VKISHISYNYDKHLPAPGHNCKSFINKPTIILIEFPACVSTSPVAYKLEDQILL